MKIHRISLSSEGYARLAYIAALEQISPKDWIEQRIEDAWSRKANSPIIQLDDKPIVNIDHKDSTEQTGNISTIDINKPKRRRILLDTAAIDQITSMWEAGERNITAIATAVARPRSTVSGKIRSLREKGDLRD